MSDPKVRLTTGPRLKIIHQRDETSFQLSPELSFKMAWTEAPIKENISFAKTKIGYTVFIPYMDFPIMFKPGDKITITLE